MSFVEVAVNRDLNQDRVDCPFVWDVYSGISMPQLTTVTTKYDWVCLRVQGTFEGTRNFGSQWTC